jgi:hypothetical protein
MFYLKSLSPAARIALFAASVLTVSALAGCQKAKVGRTGVAATAQRRAATLPAPPPTPEANIFVDEALLAKPYAIIGGAVENIGAQRLEDLSVEIELRRRADGNVERREVAVVPGDLEPGRQGKFSLKVLSEEWGGSRVVRLRSRSRQQEVAFKPQPGAKRPPERVKPNVVIVKTPVPKKSGNSDFINTPDTPYKVP